MATNAQAAADTCEARIDATAWAQERREAGQCVYAPAEIATLEKLARADVRRQVSKFDRRRITFQGYTLGAYSNETGPFLNLQLHYTVGEETHSRVHVVTLRA